MNEGVTRRPRRSLLLAAGLCGAVALGNIGLGLHRADLLRNQAPTMLGIGMSWGGLPAAARAFRNRAAQLPQTLERTPLAAARSYLLIGLGFWLAGAALVGLAFGGLRRVRSDPHKAGVLASLAPASGMRSDFHWGTLAAYGLGFFLAESMVVLAYAVLAGRSLASDGAGFEPGVGFAISFGVGVLIALVGGFVGASHARRLAIPEATIAILYFGLPIPIVLSFLSRSPFLMMKLGHRLRELVYLSSLLGESRPELGYWLVFAALALALFLGMTIGFVATSSGRFDARFSYERFIASRHVGVFRPGLIVSVLAVLVLGVIPPLILLGIVRAAQAMAERVRIRRLGQTQPLEAARALHELEASAQTPTQLMTAISVGGVGVGVMALIIVLSVMSGFEDDLRQKIVGTHADGVVLKSGESMEDYPEVMARTRNVRGVVGVTPFLMSEGMVAARDIMSGALIKGIDPQSAGSVTDLPRTILPGGDLAWLTKPSSIPIAPDEAALVEEAARTGVGEGEGAPVELLSGIILGRELAAQLRVSVGDRVNLISPLGGAIGPTGPLPKAKAFRVAGIFYSGMYEYDSKLVYVLLQDAADFFNLKGATGVEVKVADVDAARSVMRSILDVLDGYPYRTRDWGEMNSNLFAALRLEKLVMGIILSIIVVVAAGLIVATVIMLVLEKRKEIAVLKALGVPNGGIVKIFLTEGLQIGVLGGALGLIAGLVWCVFIDRVGIRLDPQVYYIHALPVRIVPFQTALAPLVAVMVTFLASLYPALKASQLDPAEGFRSE